MEQNIKLRLLDSIGKVYEQSKDCKLDSAFFENADAELKQLSDYFNVSRNQSLIVAMVFALNYKGWSGPLLIGLFYRRLNIRKYFGCICIARNDRG